MQKILAIVAIIFLVAGLGLFFYLRSDNVLQQVQKDFQEGNYPAAQEKLDTLEDRLPPVEFHLYKAYIAREQQKLSISNQELHLASQQDTKGEIVREIFLNQLFNAYLQRQPEALQGLLEAYQKIVPRKDPWVSYFQKLLATLKEPNSKNLTQLQETPMGPFYSTWMATSFEKLKQPFWLNLRKAEALIDENKTIPARQLLENLQAQADETQQQQLIFLIGLSYLQDAQERPPKASTPYYKLAFSYFKRLPTTYLQNQQEMLWKSYKDQLDRLLGVQDERDLKFYTEVLEILGTPDQLEELKTMLQKKTLAQEVDALEILQMQNLAEQLSAENLSIHPTDQQAEWSLLLLQMGQMYVERNQPEIALPLLQESVEQGAPKPFVQEALPLIATQYFALRDDEDAVMVWMVYFTRFPLEKAQRATYATALENVQRYDLALDQYHFLERHVGLDAQQKLAVVQALIYTGQFESARAKALESLESLSPEQKLVLYSMAVPIQDRNLMEEILKDFPPQSKWDQNLWQAWVNHLQKTGARDEMAKILKSHPELHAATPQMDKLSSLEQLTEQRDKILKILEKNPQRVDLRMDYAQTLIDYALAYQKVHPDIPISQIPELRTAYALSKNLSQNAPVFPEIFFNQGLAAFLFNDDLLSVEALKKTIHLNPAHANAYKFLALILLKNNHAEAALQFLDASLQYHPYDSEAWELQGDIYQKAGDGFEANKAYQEALHSNPKNVALYLKFAKLKIYLQNLDEARSLLKKALSLNPNNPEIYELLLQTLDDPLVQNEESKQNLEKERLEYETKLRKLKP